MADIKTTYMGLSLKNPIIAGASGMTGGIAAVRRIEEGGAAAVVTKSLFEEQIQLEHFKFDEDTDKGNYRNAEMITVRPSLRFAGPAEHLMWLREAKKVVQIPVIASLNAVNPETWIEYARRLEDSGVDALECNFFSCPKEMERKAARIEDEQVEIVERLKSSVRIPFGVKLSLSYTNPLQVIRRMDRAGAAGFVLFNRMVEPDIDIQEEKITNPLNISHETDYRGSLRYAGLLAGEIRADVCCATGFFTGSAVVKAILAGAQVVQTVSSLYKDGPGHIRAMAQSVETWMGTKGYTSLADFRGKLSKRRSNDPSAYTRGQYARFLMNPDEIVRNFAVV